MSEMLAGTKRSTRGLRMDALIDSAQEDDEFYKQIFDDEGEAVSEVRVPLPQLRITPHTYKLRRKR